MMSIDGLCRVLAEHARKKRLGGFCFEVRPDYRVTIRCIDIDGITKSIEADIHPEAGVLPSPTDALEMLMGKT